MDSDECFVCFSPYDVMEHVPGVLICCGQSLCLNCFKDESLLNCPNCRVAIPSPKTFVKNFGLISILESRENHSPKSLLEHFLHSIQDAVREKEEKISELEAEAARSSGVKLSRINAQLFEIKGRDTSKLTELIISVECAIKKCKEDQFFDDAKIICLLTKIEKLYEDLVKILSSKRKKADLKKLIEDCKKLGSMKNKVEVEIKEDLAPVEEEKQKRIHLEKLKAKYFNVRAGLVDGWEDVKSLEKDEFGNPVSTDCDLGKPGAFSEFHMIFYTKYTAETLGETAAVYNLALETLKSIPGFKIIVASSDCEFITLLDDSKTDCALLISGLEENMDLSRACKRFVFETMRPLILFADNQPLIGDANSILKQFYSDTFQIAGSDPGQGILAPDDIGRGQLVGTFGKHLLTTGIVSLYEGVTISYPTTSIPEGLQVLATNTSGHPVIMFDDPPMKVRRGRFLLDCGFTKLWDCMWDKTAGTARYLRNAVVWSLGLEKRSYLGLPAKGAVDAAGMPSKSKLLLKI